MQLSNKELGKLGEDFAAIWLINRGFSILDRNWRSGRVELDLVVRRNNLIVFVEVKTRSNYQYGGAVQAVSGQKINNLKQAALRWLIENQQSTPRIRIDLLALQYDGKSFQVIHIPGLS